MTRPIQPSQLRPICLTSTVCKLFEKLLSVRLRPCLPEFRCAQLGARKSCQVLDGITTAQMMLQLSKSQKQPLLAMKLDFKAAFDSVHHRSIGALLYRATPCREAFYDFGNLLILRRLMLCVISRICCKMCMVDFKFCMMEGCRRNSTTDCKLSNDFCKAGTRPWLNKCMEIWARECRDLGRAMLQQSRVLEALMRADPLIGAHLSVTLTACIKHVRRMCAWECRANPALSPTPDCTQAHSSW